MEIFLKTVSITAFSTLLLSYLMTERLVLNREGGGRMGGLQCKLLSKGTEECPSGCRWRGRGLDLGVGEAVGQGGHFNDDNP